MRVSYSGKASKTQYYKMAADDDDSHDDDLEDEDEDEVEHDDGDRCFSFRQSLPRCLPTNLNLVCRFDHVCRTNHVD